MRRITSGVSFRDRTSSPTMKKRRPNTGLGEQIEKSIHDPVEIAVAIRMLETERHE
jgi:hypothetical protein